MQTIVVTHILPTKSAFAATVERPSQGVFIPGRLSADNNIVVGQEISALLVPNTMQPDRTPWLAVKLRSLDERSSADTAKSHTSVDADIMALLSEGGVWTAEDVATEKSIPEAVAKPILERFYAESKCARFTLNEKGKITQRWYTCYPENADVDEWA